MAQEGENREVEIDIYFATSKWDVDSTLAQNREALRSIDSLVTTINNDSAWVVKSISIKGSASPEGSASFNRTLSENRAAAISRYFASYTDSAAVPTTFAYLGANWEGLRAMVEADASTPDRTEVLRIIDMRGVDRLARLRRTSGGRTYGWLLRNIFPALRSSHTAITLHRQEAPRVIIERQPESPLPAEPEPIAIEPEVELPEPVVIETVVEPHEPVEIPVSCPRKLYFKTNAAAIALAIPNIAFELDIAEHLSVTLPVYYSAWEYGSHRVKFRTLAFEPELRLWSEPCNMGFFGGAHFGVAQYNFAIGGRYRFQDHAGHTPALGGGVSIGYRCHLGHAERWLIEFAVGAGCYHLYYDVFDNRPGVKQGQKLYEKHKTFFGIDNVGLTFIYVLPLSKKGGQR